MRHERRNSCTAAPDRLPMLTRQEHLSSIRVIGQTGRLLTLTRPAASRFDQSLGDISKLAMESKRVSINSIAWHPQMYKDDYLHTSRLLKMALTLAQFAASWSTLHVPAYEQQRFEDLSAR